MDLEVTELLMLTQNVLLPLREALSQINLIVSPVKAAPVGPPQMWLKSKNFGVILGSRSCLQAVVVAFRQSWLAICWKKEMVKREGEVESMMYSLWLEVDA